MSAEQELDANTIRQLEVEAYSALISTFFAQGELTWRKEQLLQEARWALKISDDLHRRELQRVHNDTMLAKIRNNSIKDQYFPGVTPAAPPATEDTMEDAPEESASQKRLYVYPAARTLKGEPLSVPGNILASPSPKIQTPPKPTPPNRSSSNRSSRKKTSTTPQKPVESPVVATPVSTQISSAIMSDGELLKLKIKKANLEAEKEAIAKELNSVIAQEEKKRLEMPKIDEEEEEEEEESDSESGESVDDSDSDEMTIDA